MKSKIKHKRVGVASGYGPMHAMNAQEGSEAVPSPLPSVPDVPPDRGTRLMREIIRQAREGIGMSPEQVAQIRRNPLGAKALASYAQAGIMLMPEFGGEKPSIVPKAAKLKDVPEAFKGLEGLSHLQDTPSLNEPPSEGVHEPDISKLTPEAQNSHLNWLDEMFSGAKEKASSEGEPTHEELNKAFGTNMPEGMTMEELLDWYATGKKPQKSPPEGMKRGKRVVGVAKGFGPMHAENAKEGQHVDLTKINSDTVPAVLTPREAVLNRNAAELAGRGKIEALNAEGNALARKGVDLASGGMSDVKEKIMKSKPKQSKPQSGSPYVQAFQNLMPKGGAPVGYEQGVGGVPSQAQRPMPGPFAPPSPQPRPQGGMPPAQMPPIYNGGGGLFPPRQTVGLASGTGSVPLPGPIGTPPQGEEAYGPPVNLTAPQIQRLAQQTGLSAGQIQGLMSAVQGIGGIGGGNANATGTGTLIDSGGMAYPTTGGYQGGISDIGYPPFVAPSANYDGNRGGWLGPYDPSFMIQRYAGGISSVPFR